jgi:Aspartate/tyrosine/aromatic aminotransferase
MEVVSSGTEQCAIVEIGDLVRRLSQETGQEYLALNRGINAVVNIDLNDVVKDINFNSPEIQIYPPTTGFPALKEAINAEYFGGKAALSNISITGGGMAAIDLAFQTVNVEKVYVPEVIWESYFMIMKMRGKTPGLYHSLSSLKGMVGELKGNAVLICDPSNPVGDKFDDEKLFELIKFLNDNGVVVFCDCPYRRIFKDDSDDFYQKIFEMENVVITESFSKSVGLSGIRLGFIHSTNPLFNKEILLRLLFGTNGINGFAQQLVLRLLTTDAGKKAVNEFKKKTVEGITKNIQFLRDNGFLAEEFYKESTPVGIFTILNLPYDELMKYRIASVSLTFFAKEMIGAEKYSRICVSVPHERLKAFFQPLIKK